MTNTKNASYLLLLSAALMLPLVCAAFAVDESQESFMIAIDYDNSSYTLSKVLLMQAAPPDLLNQPETGFRADVVSVNDEILYSFKFNQPNIIAAIPLDKTDTAALNGCQQQDKGSFTVQAPYFPTAQRVNIYRHAG